MVFEFGEAGNRRRLYVELKPRFLRQDMNAFRAFTKRLRSVDHNSLTLLAVPYLTHRNREELRRAHINHADLRGALFIREPGFYVDLQSDILEPSLDAIYQPSGINPFADKASLVLRVLFESPKQVWRMTDISARAHLTKGWVSLVSAELVKRGLLSRVDSGLQLSNPVNVLKDWSAVYSWRRNRIESYVAPFDYDELRQKAASLLARLKSQWAFTLLAGADLVASHVQHEQLHAYLSVKDFAKARAALRKELHLEQVPEGGNFHLLEPFYACSVFYSQRLVNESSVVSDLQLYLDLVHYPVRGIEAAAMLMRTRLAPAMNLNPREIAELL